MSTNYSNEPLLDMYIFETEQLLGQLEQLILDSEKTDGFSREAIDEIFRIMHTIKGSSAMMMFNGVSNLAHCMEDLFYCLRDGKYESIDSSYISDMVFEGIDFIKEEITKIKNGDTTEGDPLIIIKKINTHIKELKGDVSAVSDHQKEAGAENLQKASQSENSQYYPKYAYKAVRI